MCPVGNKKIGLLQVIFPLFVINLGTSADTQAWPGVQL